MRRHPEVCFIVFALLTACNSEQRDPSQWPLTRAELEKNAPVSDPGEATFRRYCVACHGADGHANGGVTGADFVADKAALSLKTDEELATSVREGRRGARGVMPAHKPVLSEAQIDDVVRYVRKRFWQDEAKVP